MPEEKMNVEEFPGNSRSDPQKEEPEETKKIKQVATATRVVKKKTFLDNFIGATLKTVGIYIVVEILIPAAKQTISDMITNGTDMVLFGEPKTRRRDRDRTGGTE